MRGGTARQSRDPPVGAAGRWSCWGSESVISNQGAFDPTKAWSEGRTPGSPSTVSADVSGGKSADEFTLQSGGEFSIRRTRVRWFWGETRHYERTTRDPARLRPVAVLAHHRRAERDLRGAEGVVFTLLTFIGARVAGKRSA
jgi:hypothetical protein